MSHNESMRFLRASVLLVCSLLLSSSLISAAASETKLTVDVSSAGTGRKIEGASVIVHFKHGLNPIKMSKIRTSWETKTNQQGSVAIPAIPMGEVTIQIIAQHYQTFGDVFQLTEPEQTITIKLNAPQAQYSEDAKPDKKK
jgi:hypothetical protein